MTFKSDQKNRVQNRVVYLDAFLCCPVSGHRGSLNRDKFRKIIVPIKGYPTVSGHGRGVWLRRGRCFYEGTHTGPIILFSNFDITH